MRSVKIQLDSDLILNIMPVTGCVKADTVYSVSIYIADEGNEEDAYGEFGNRVIVRNEKVDRNVFSVAHEFTNAFKTLKGLNVVVTAEEKKIIKTVIKSMLK